MNHKTLISKLIDFKNQNKFSLSEWEERGLNPSEEIVINEMSTTINSFLTELINTLKTHEKNAVFKNEFLFLFNGINLENFDTEEREFILHYLFEISSLCKLNISNELNKLLYGEIITDLISDTESPKVEESNYVQSYKIDEPCQNCGNLLKSLAIDDQKQIKFIGIVECFKCRKKTLIHFPEELKIIDFYNYKIIEKSPYSKKKELELKEKLKTA